VISGVFSLTCQAIHLEYFPRMKIIHTSNNQAGQVYVPFISKLMFVLTSGAVLIFKKSALLANAYGMTISAIMVITTLLTAFYLFYQRHWSFLKLFFTVGILFIIDSFFFSTTLIKFTQGGWFPLSISLGFLTIILTWRKGNNMLRYEKSSLKVPLSLFIRKIFTPHTFKIPGTAIFIRHHPKKLPPALLAQLEHNKFLHTHTIFLSIVTDEELPRIPPQKKMKISKIAKNIDEITVHYGFREIPNLHTILDKLVEKGIKMDLNNTSFILNKIIPVASSLPSLKGWQEKLFIFLMHNALSVTDFYKIPHHRVLELGIRLKV
jgi:KUP system potassium uptake protein